MACELQVKPFVYLLVILFGMGSWIAVNGLWLELPILVYHAPESWKLSSYLAIITQIANIGPLMYALVNKCAPKYFNEKHGVYLIVTVGAAACLLLVFCWNDTSYIGGVKRSTGLMLSVLLLSLVDCTSSVVFLPYMSLFKPQYISALYIGEGLSGLVPSLVALGQGVGKTDCINTTVNSTHQIVEKYLPPRFPVEDFFYFLFSIMLICGISFTLLNYLPYCKMEHVAGHRDFSYKDDLVPSDTVLHRNTEFQQETTILNDDTRYKLERPISKTKLTFFLVTIGVINAMVNGVLPSISTYATIPYGSEAYHLSVTLSNIANPLACFVAFFLPVISTKVIGGTAIIGVAAGLYILVMATLSPFPLLVNETSGSAIIVIASVLVTVLVTFCKVSIATVLRLHGRTALLWCGIVTQIGSCIGAIVSFIAVNILHVFHERQACSS
ncbi:hypothetical protein ACF0H5_003432 [Mactra antiquata]